MDKRKGFVFVILLTVITAINRYTGNNKQCPYTRCIQSTCMGRICYASADGNILSAVHNT